MASLSEPPGESDGEVDSSRSDRQQYNRYNMKKMMMVIVCEV